MSGSTIGEFSWLALDMPLWENILLLKCQVLTNEDLDDIQDGT